MWFLWAPPRAPLAERHTGARCTLSDRPTAMFWAVMCSRCRADEPLAWQCIVCSLRASRFSGIRIVVWLSSCLACRRVCPARAHARSSVTVLCAPTYSVPVRTQTISGRPLRPGAARRCTARSQQQTNLEPNERRRTRDCAVSLPCGNIRADTRSQHRVIRPASHVAQNTGRATQHATPPAASLVFGGVSVLIACAMRPGSGSYPKDCGTVLQGSS